MQAEEGTDGWGGGGEGSEVAMLSFMTHASRGGDWWLGRGGGGVRGCSAELHDPCKQRRGLVVAGSGDPGASSSVKVGGKEGKGEGSSKAVS